MLRYSIRWQMMINYGLRKYLFSCSVVDVVIALEVVRVLVFVDGALHLHHGVVQVVLAATQISHLTESLQWVVRLDVDSHGELSN